MALARASVAKPVFSSVSCKPSQCTKSPAVVSAAPHPVESVKALVQDIGKVAAAAIVSTVLIAGSANAITYDELQGLSYKEVKGSGLANVCPVLPGGTGDITALKAGSYQLSKFCLEPTEFTVKEESQFRGGQTDFVKTKLMTRLTYTLDQMSGTFESDGKGNVKLIEEDGIDFAPVTVQLPGGERVPFLFTAKELKAAGKADGFSGSFVVPSYRGSSFLDPKGRGGSTGYDAALALPARSDSEEFERENIKNVAAMTGTMKLSVAKYDAETGEIGGVFESIQPSDTDLGGKDPKDIKITGLWYAQLS